ncbi:MAG TPA: aminotransferase class I/II-fold pyridoxal phosphate-dependent enzyme [Stellaceae bacterium]|nr:aminotransferase class I/II-fold pyridoxal phosphate-dependent enzyme [Stellaceae bacterium]
MDIRDAQPRLTPDQRSDLAKKLLEEVAAAAAGTADGVPKSHYRFDQHPMCLNLARGAVMLGSDDPYFRLHEGTARDTTRIGGREYINFSNYNYLGLSGHPALNKAVIEAIERYGTSVSASRMVGGERPIHQELEAALAELHGTEDALVMVSGYGTNVTAIAHLFGPKDLILHDALIHNSVIMGAILSGARRIPFKHNDWEAVDDLLRKTRRDYERVLVVVEGIYSMDGDFPDLPSFVEIRNRHKVFLMVDEAHSVGVMGRRGRGIHEHFGLSGDDVDIWMGTLSKALASCGGYVAGCNALTHTLRYTAPGFVFSVGQSAANAAAALAAIEVMRTEPERVQQLQQRGKLFLKLARERGLPTGLSQGYSVVPLIVGATPRCIKLTEALFRRGIHVQPILYPAVDERSTRLRFFLTCTHTEEQIRQAIDIIDQEWRALRAS